MAFITIAGENKIAYQQGNSLLLNITHFVLANITGLGAEPVNRIEALPAGGDIVHTQVVTHKGYVNANQVVYSLAMDSTIGDFDFNWVGLKDADNVLIACAHITPQHKSANAGAVPGNNLTRNFLLAFSGIAATTAIAVPAETWQIDFTTRLLQIDERERLSNFDIYGQFSAFGDGFKVTLQSGSDYSIAAGICYVGGIRCEQLAAAIINVTGLPKSIWIDASLQGDINGVSAVFSFSATAATLTNYTDGLGFKHYVAKICDIGAGGAIGDLRKIYKIPSATETVEGIAEIATQAETDAGTDDARIVTPKKLRWGFSASFTNVGYLALPTWLGALIINWGTVSVTTANVSQAFTLAQAFPVQFFGAVCIHWWGASPTSISTMAAGFVNLSQIIIRSSGNGSGSFYIALGK